MCDAAHALYICQKSGPTIQRWGRPVNSSFTLYVQYHFIKCLPFILNLYQIHIFLLQQKEQMLLDIEMGRRLKCKE